MTAPSTLLTLVQDRVDQFLDAQEQRLREISPLSQPIVDRARDLMRGGKRFRPQFCYWGWRAVEGVAGAGGDVPSEPVSRAQLDSVLTWGTAIEFFHAAALVHDDVIDHSDTRRGLPAAHVAFAAQHRDDDWRGDPERFGQAAAIVLGDVLLGWADALFARSVAAVPSPDHQHRLRALIDQMSTDVMVGQFLDITGEHAWPVLSEAESLERAETVILYKSAKYSIEQPVLAGAIVGGADDDQLQALSEFGTRTGQAFQLRDDVLGVFGDPSVTGKPAGDDLREGKRTVLIALTRQLVPAGVRHVIDDLLGDEQLTDEQIALLQTTVRESGALDATERLIDEHASAARRALDAITLSEHGRAALLDLADQAAQRQH